MQHTQSIQYAALHKTFLGLVIMFAIMGIFGNTMVIAQNTAVKAPDGNGKSAPKTQVSEKVTVNATPILAEEGLDTFGSPVAIVTGKQLVDLNAMDLAAALRRVPGVVISRYNMVGSYGGAEGGAVFVRSHGSGRPGAEISVLEDGIPRFAGIWTHPLLDRSNPDFADRIEIYKSAQPVLFGNTAFGAINLVPKKTTQEGITGRVVAVAGGNGTWMGTSEIGGKTDAVDFYFVANHKQSSGHRQNSGGQIDGVYGRLGIDMGKGWETALIVDASRGWAEDPGIAGAPALPVVPRFANKAVFSTLTISHSGEKETSIIKVYSDHGQIDWLQWEDKPKSSLNSITSYENVGLRWRETLRLWEGGEIITGIDHDRQKGRLVEWRKTGAKTYPDDRLTSTAPYAVVTHTFGEHIRMTPSFGLRYNLSKEYGNDLGWQAGVVARSGKTELHLGASRAFNLPGTWAAFFYRSWGRGEQWKNLEAERLTHLEIGAVQRLSERHELGLTYFRDRVTNALRFVPPPPPPPLFANTGSYSTRGLEGHYSFALADGFAFFAGATWTSTTPDKTPNAPNFTATTGVNANWRKVWRFALDAQWVDDYYTLNPRFGSPPQKVDAYLLVNGRVAFELKTSLQGARTEIFVAGENLTNTRYGYRPGYPMPGRTILAGFEIKR